ncbi:MAG: UDP-2,3-diacylglucosamine diphosphatase [Ignavibacteriae bacterium]|nr:UDP-2,3-diacylglucosamine diphosphatase [Ignavibacteriota bacterium]
MTPDSPPTQRSAPARGKILYFISDVHLGLSAPGVERIKRARLLEVLKEVQDHRGDLYIVGDLFDFWFEYRSVVPRGHHAVLSALENLAQSGARITYLAGNHDFAIGQVLRDDLGVDIIRDDVTFSIDGRSFYVYHGDGLADKDAGYRAIKAILRNPLAQWLFRWLHPDIGFALARMSSHSSRKYTGTKKYGETDGMHREAMRRIDAGASCVVMGHRHQATLQRMGQGLYVNLGDWITSYTYAVYHDGFMRLYSRKDDREVLIAQEACNPNVSG